MSSQLPPYKLYADHSNRTRVAIGFGIALPIIAVTLRVAARRIRRLPLGPDDYCIFAAAVRVEAIACGSFE